MATSGSFKAYCTTSGVTDKYIKFEWTATQSVANNTSTISWKLLGGDPDGGYVKAGGFQVIIDGDTEYSKPTDYRIKMYTDTVIASGSKTITHNADGTREFTVRIRAGIYNSGINTDGSKEFTLTTIPRKSSLSVSNGTLGTAQTLAVTRQSTSFKHSIKAVVSGTGTATYYINASGGLSTTEVKHTATSIPFTPPLSWASQNTTGTSVSVTYTITTYNGSTNVGANSYTKTYQMPASIKPTCLLSVSDAAGYKDVFGAYIQGKSKFKLSAAMEYAYGSPLSSKSITADGKTYSADTAATAIIANAGTLTISASVKDKRGREGTDSESVNVAKYTAPKISSLSVHRCNEDGTLNSTGSFAKATYSFAIDDFSAAESDLGITMTADNAHSVKVQYKKSTATSWTDGETVSAYTATGRSFIFAAADDASYDVRVVATDSFGSVTKSTSVSTAEVLMHFGADGKSIALGKVSEKSNAIEFGKDMFDRFGTMVGNGIGYYESGGVADPDTTLESLIITKVNTPVDGVFYYIQTDFYSTKSVTSNRAQFAIPYASNNPAATRYFYNGAWSDWMGLTNESMVANAINNALANYISKSGGTYTGNVTISNTSPGFFSNNSSTGNSLRTFNSTQGYGGLWDATAGSAILSYNFETKLIENIAMKASAVETAVSITYNSTNTRSPSATIKYNKLTGTCFMRLYFLNNVAFTAGTEYEIGTIASGYRPSYVHALAHYATKDAEVVINGSGVIKLVPHVAMAAGHNNYVSGFWFV